MIWMLILEALACILAWIMGFMIGVGHAVRAKNNDVKSGYVQIGNDIYRTELILFDYNFDEEWR